MYPIWKRALDVAFSLLGSVVTILILPFVALAILVESGFPVFVRLDRVSEGKLIRVWKFRSMIRGAHEMKKELESFNERRDGPLFKISNDPRVTKVGRFLRKTRVDEFPQFFNVLVGELALVGPRPHEPGEIEKYPEGFKHLAESRAGLTGLSQVRGASALTFREELEYDSYYVEKQSLLLDLKILFRTVFIFFFDPTGV